MEMEGTQYSSKLQGWSLTIRCSFMSSRKLGELGGGRSYLSAEMHSVYSTAPGDWAKKVVLEIFFESS